MNKKILISLTAAVLLLALTVSASAAPSVYVKNRPAGTGVPSRGQIYVDLQKFLSAGGYGWKMQGNTLIISDKGGTQAVNQVPSGYIYNGTSISAHTFMVAGRPYVLAQSFVGGLGLASRYTKSADAYDYFPPSMVPPSREVKEPEKTDTKTDAKTDAKTDDKKDEGDKTDEKSKQKMVNFKGTKDKLGDSLIVPHNTFFYDFNTNELRGNIQFENKYDKDPITKVSVVFSIVVGKDNTSIWSKRFDIGEMQPNSKTQKSDYYFVNPSGVDIFESNFYYDINYLEPKKPEKKK